MTGYADPPPELVWNKVYDSGDNDLIRGIAVDGMANSYVTGASMLGTDANCRTIKYDASGVELWNKVFDSGYNEEATGIAVDQNGNVYIVGDVRGGTDHDGLIVKYNTDGVQQWSKIYNSGTDDGFRGVAVDPSGSIYVTGYSSTAGGTYDFRTIKYAPDGFLVWDKTYDAGDEGAYGIAVDNLANVYLTGYHAGAIDNDILTMKWNSDGTPLWKQFYDSGDYEDASAIAVDGTGVVYVVGRTDHTPGYDYLIIQYDTQGNMLWVKTYDSGFSDEAWGVTVDQSGYSYVTGNSMTDTTLLADYNARTIKFDTDGNLRWNLLYDSGVQDFGMDVVIDQAGFLYLAVSSGSYGAYDYRVMKYRQPIAVGEEPPALTDIPLTIRPSGGGDQRIRFVLTRSADISLAVFDAAGRVVAVLVDGHLDAGGHECSWKAEASGIYVVRIQGDNFEMTRKVVVVK
jgi:hypothetical protein